jgi:hypothetical protein
MRGNVGATVTQPSGKNLPYLWFQQPDLSFFGCLIVDFF